MEMDHTYATDRNSTANLTIESLYSIEEDPIYIASRQIWIYSAPVLLLVGTITNCLTISVLLRKRLRKRTTIFYLTVLAVLHLLALYVGLCRAWLKFSFGFDIGIETDIFCRFFTFIINFLLNMSVWVLVAVTIDRCVIVCLPNVAKRVCRLKYSKRIVAVIFASLLLADLHILWGVSIQKAHGSTEEECTHGNYFNQFIFPWISLSIGFIVPFLIMIVANFLIVRCVYLSQKRLTYHYSNTSTGSHKSTSANHGSKVSSVTTMLLARNASFLILTLPIMIFLIVEPYHVSNQDTVAASMYLTWAIVNICDYTDHAVSFFLYCLAGTTFRKELYIMLGKTNSRHNLDSA